MGMSKPLGLSPGAGRGLISKRSGVLERGCRASVALILCALGLVYYTNTFVSRWLTRPEKYNPTSRTQDDDFRWEDITPSTSLHYTPCFSHFQCARLSVPLNWNTTEEVQENGPRAAIAVIKLPAQVSVTDVRYGGPIVINPGGPGESGVYQALTDGKSLQIILDAGPAPTVDDAGAVDGKYFDILSFDPRGVNNTTPKLRCFADAFNQQAWLLGLPDYGMLWSSESVTGMEWGRSAALGASCSHGEDDTGILAYANTPQTVEDMVQLVEKEAEWRAKAAKRLLADAGDLDSNNSREILERTAYHLGHEMIQYWGMSYGTLIGATFAAMHPDRVGRMVIDGVVDPADHYAGDWLTQMQDSDTIISKFCEYCYQAGPSQCPLYVGSSSTDIEARFTSILMDLKERPIAMPPPDSGKGNAGPALVTYGDAHLALLSGMYFPFAMAESLFDLIRAVETRNVSSPALKGVVATKQAQLAKAGCQDDDNLSPEECIPFVSGFGAFQAISCMDMGGPSNMTRADFDDYLTEAQSQSRWLSLSWARNKMACLGYTVHPAWRPSLTFETRGWANTSHPLLIIGNSHDTVTPIRNARRVASLFPRSVVLHQDSQGHCSHSTPTLCTAKMVRRYFQTGVLPDEGHVCVPEVRPFLGCLADGDGHRGEEGECRFVDGEDERLWETMMELADPFGLRPKEAKNEDGGNAMRAMYGRIPGVY